MKPATNTDLGKRYRGKVRDTYRVDDRLILVTTDRISAFDYVLRQTIPFCALATGPQRDGGAPV